MSSLADIDPSVVYAMFKGEPGTRKSTQALSFPKPQYWFSWDQKMNSLLLPMIKWGINPREIDSDDYKDWNGARQKLKQLQLNCKYRTLVIDSLTSCADFTLMQTRDVKQGTTTRSGGQAGKQVAGIIVNELEDYNAEASALAELIAITKDIKQFHKVNIILIAHVVQAEYRNTTTNLTHVSRTIVTAGKRVAPKIPAYCDEVYHFNIEKAINADQEGTYCAITTHTGDDFARTALELPHIIKFGNDPLYDKFVLPAINKMKAWQQEFKNKEQQQKQQNPNTIQQPTNPNQIKQG